MFVRRLAQSLNDVGVDPAMRRRIMAGSGRIRAGASPEQKARWYRGVIERMDMLLDRPTRIRSRELCACSRTPWRLDRMRRLGRAHKDWDGLAAAIQRSRLMGAGVKREGDRVMVRFGVPACVCHAIRASTEPVSVTYCHCCKGHLMVLFEAALGRPVRMDVLESRIAGGRDCRFAMRIDADPGPGRAKVKRR
ncbi:hypothetical protein FJY71_03390 [candidate division WOR-3 bacterium]|nr:hypothetical protein [candidate division WOR-3 bacterium]